MAATGVFNRSDVLTYQKRPSSPKSNPEFEMQSAQIVHECLYGLLLDDGARLNGYTYGSMEPVFSNEETKRAFKAVKGACKEFINLHDRELKLSVDKLDMSDTAVCNTYHDTVCAIFQTEINWGRIISAICVSRTMALKAFRDNRPFLIESIEGWLQMIVIDRLQSWIIQHGGWVSLTFSIECKYCGSTFPSLTRFHILSIMKCLYF